MAFATTVTIYRPGSADTATERADLLTGYRTTRGMVILISGHIDKTFRVLSPRGKIVSPEPSKRMGFAPPDYSRGTAGTPASPCASVADCVEPLRRMQPFQDISRISENMNFFRNLCARELLNSNRNTRCCRLFKTLQRPAESSFQCWMT